MIYVGLEFCDSAFGRMPLVPLKTFLSTSVLWLALVSRSQRLHCTVHSNLRRAVSLLKITQPLLFGRLRDYEYHDRITQPLFCTPPPPSPSHQEIQYTERASREGREQNCTCEIFFMICRHWQLTIFLIYFQQWVRMAAHLVLDKSKPVNMHLAYAVRLMSLPTKPALELFLMSKPTWIMSRESLLKYSSAVDPHWF